MDKRKHAQILVRRETRCNLDGLKRHEYYSYDDTIMFIIEDWIVRGGLQSLKPIAYISGPTPRTATLSPGQTLSVGGRALDSSKRPLRFVMVYPVVQPQDASLEVQPPITTDSSGKYFFSYCPPTAGMYSIWFASNPDGT